MRSKGHSAAAATAAQPPRRALERVRRGHRDSAKAVQSRAQQKQGAYKRLEIFLGQEAAIELRRLMRDGRSAREVIETLLLSEKRRQELA